MFARNMSALMMAAGLVFAGAASAATTAPVGNGSDYPAYPAAHSTLTRAEVQAKVTEAQRNGSMAVIGDRMNTFRAESAPSTLSRAQVQQQAHDALVAGTLPEGESFGE
ncbi:DUF4148 domain-containing protein [Comamonas sp. SY3]|uniref:DUF4148 domain-containing protein n=1 Tax=Comamonas sp. SY3 TaxID=3243601 RepID=UPI003593F12D